MENPQRIIRFTLENFKNVKFLDIPLNPSITKVTGGNGAGKTSTLDGLFYSLLPRKTVNAAFIRKGQKQGFMRVEFPDRVLTRKLDADGGDIYVEMKGSKTVLKDPIDWLKTLTGDLGFDPLAFVRMKADEQFDVLKPLVKLDIDLDALEAQNDIDESEKTDAKKAAKQYATARDSIKVDQSINAEMEIDIASLQKEAQDITEHNETVFDLQQERAQFQRDHASVVEATITAENKVERLERELAQAREEWDNSRSLVENMEKVMGEWTPIPDLIDRKPKDDAIREAASLNARIAVNEQNREQWSKWDQNAQAKAALVERLTERIKQRKLAIGKALEKAKFPIPGLSFTTLDEDAKGEQRKLAKRIVTYKGVPLSEASTGEQIRVSAAIGMAGKPDLRFMLIREGSLLDDEGMTILEEMARENFYQVLIECVNTTGTVGIYMKDGEVAAINAEPEPVQVHFNADEAGGPGYNQPPAPRKRAKKEPVN